MVSSWQYAYPSTGTVHRSCCSCHGVQHILRFHVAWQREEEVAAIKDEDPFCVRDAFRVEGKERLNHRTFWTDLFLNGGRRKKITPCLSVAPCMFLAVQLRKNQLHPRYKQDFIYGQCSLLEGRVEVYMEV